MSQPGYGYDVPQGFHIESAFSNPSYPPYPQSSQRPNEPTNATAQKPGDTSLQSYGRSSGNVIPGLGLGFSTGGTERQSSWDRPHPGSWYSTSQLSQSGARGLSQRPAASADLNESTTIVARGDAVYDGSEEGEVSEGEVEDIYEPRGVDGEANASEAQAWPHADTDLGNVDPIVERGDTLMTGDDLHPQAPDGKTGWSAEHSGSAGTARERSGSYSPYLSPREINHDDTTDTPVYNDSCSRLNPPTNQTASSNEVVEPPRSMAAQSSVATQSPVKTASMAKKRAQDAILRLWPLKVRYQNYVSEGIDGKVLGGLFKDLGLGVQEEVLGLEEPKISRIAKPEAKPPSPPENESASPLKATPSPLESTNAQPAGPVDKSEERKDRIARLLAAKGSKPAVTTTTAAPKTIPAALSQPSTKSQSEKSKLLHQKMEALRQSREALAQSLSEQSPASEPTAAKVETEKTAMPDVTASSLHTSGELSSLPTPSNQGDGSANGPGKLSPPIPGLFLSSTLQPLQVSEPMGQRHHPTPRRPFGQNMESRPLLINVSDDENDAEMDIDSSGHLSSPANRPDTPSQRAAALRDISTISSNIATCHTPTPTSIAMPPRNSGPNGGGEDLASMNKKIEAMKRKIAEAEARKKAKLSRQVSPTFSHSNDSSRDDSAEAPSTARGFTASALSMGGGHMPTNVDPSDRALASIPQERASCSRMADRGHRTDKRGRSRAASERLPFIEAHRREQLLKLKSLQSQIANIERQIEEGMREEEILKQELVGSDSDQDQSQAARRTAPSSVEGGLPTNLGKRSAPTDAMDSTSGSPVASEDPGNGHDDTLAKDSERNHPGTTRDSIHSGDGQRRQSRQDEDSHEAPAVQASWIADEDEAMLGAQPEHDKSWHAQESDPDVIMAESCDSTGEESEEGTDDYEPPDAEMPAVGETSPHQPASAPADEGGTLPDPAGHDENGTPVSASIPQQIPASQADSIPESGRKGEVVPLTQTRPVHSAAGQVRQQYQSSTSEETRARFVPYETPLKYFRSYRFHPEFGQSVAGGLRSLTYSNKIDVKKEVCPDELSGQQCPRGSQCEFQHFEDMKAPDDQILLQLGAAGNYQDKQKQEYIAGLRQLLTDFRNRKIKDFNTISRGIIEYRASFNGDKSRILPLGDVAI